MTSTPGIRARLPRLLLLVGGLALMGGGPLGGLHLACAHGAACAATAGAAADPSGDPADDCAVCRLLQGAPPALVGAWTPPRAEPVTVLPAAPARATDRLARPQPCGRAPPLAIGFA
jgi:hypothetical protein